MIIVFTKLTTQEKAKPTNEYYMGQIQNAKKKFIEDWEIESLEKGHLH